MKYSKFNLLVEGKDNKKLLFNTMSGNNFVISDDLCDALKSGNVDVLDEDVRKAFIEKGILIDDKIDENKYFAYYHNKTKFDNSSVGSTILLTWACNFACVYCFEGAGEKVLTLTKENADKYIKFMKNQAKARKTSSMNITLFGGEPLVNIKMGFEILDELHSFCDEESIQFTCGIITNGTLLTDEVLDKLKAHNCNMIQITLDGMKEVHDSRRPYKGGRGSFDDVIAAIKKVNDKEGVHGVIRINVDKTNIDEAFKLLKYLGKDGENLTNCTVDFGIVRGSTMACSAYAGNCFVETEIGEILDVLWAEAEKNGFIENTTPMRRWMYCGLYSDSQFTVTPDAAVYKCWEHAGMDEHKMGELDENGNFVNPQFAYFDWMSTTPTENEDCAACVYLPVCGGGCGVVSYNETQSYHSKGCFKVRGVVEKQVERYVNKKLEHKCSECSAQCEAKDA